MKRISHTTDEDASLIDNLVSLIDSSQRNSCGVTYLNEVKNEILSLNRFIPIPRIPVGHIHFDEIAPAVKDLCAIIPEYLKGHTLLAKQKPPSETHFLHFVKRYKGISRDFIHLFKLDFRFTSDMGKNYHDGTADYYPSYSVERVPYKSFLIPVEKIEDESGRITDFSAARILKKEDIEGDRHFMTHMIFDEFDPTELNEKIADLAGRDIFPFSLRLYPLLVYGYFSVCMNIPYPDDSEIIDALYVFEPIAEKIIASFGDPNRLAEVVSSHPGELVVKDDALAYTETFAARAKKYFSRYSLFQDDELA
ncbi:MAG TPA: hypothetical protein VF857_04790, partial [Spirochaetota bacterium]